MHRAHQFQLFLKKSLLENDVLRCAVTREEVFLGELELRLLSFIQFPPSYARIEINHEAILQHINPFVGPLGI